MTKQLVWFGMAVMTTLLALVLLWQFQIVVIYVLISLMLAAALRPLVNRLVGRGYKLRAAWSLLYLVVMGSFGYLLYFTGETAIDEIQRSAHTVPVQDAWRLPVWLEGSSLQYQLVALLPPPSTIFKAITGSQGQFVLPALFDFTQGFGGAVSGLLIILLLSVYWSISKSHFERFWLSLLPPDQRKQARDILRTVEPNIGAYIRSQVVQGLLAWLLFGLGYWLLGSPYATLLALASALACLIPVVGAVLAAHSAALGGAAHQCAAQLVYGALYDHRLDCSGKYSAKPRLFNRRWDNPILTVVLLIAMADALLALSASSSRHLCQLCARFCGATWSATALLRGLRLRSQTSKSGKKAYGPPSRGMDEPPPPLVTSSMERLAALIAKAEPILQFGPKDNSV